MSKLYEKIELWKKQSYSIMIIPNAGSSMKQIRIQALCVYSALFLVTAAGLFFAVATFTLIQSNFVIHFQNFSLSNTMNEKNTAIETLRHTNSQLQNENSRLKQSAELSTQYFNRRVADLNQLQSQVDTLMEIFNQQNHSDIRVKSNRSSPEIQLAQILPALKNARSIGELEQGDSITQEMTQSIDSYRQVVLDVQKVIGFIDGKPDRMPLHGPITSPFGVREDPFNFKEKSHQGVDIDGNTGDSVSAAGAGVITFAGYSGSYGNMIVISHGFGYKSAYAHLSEICVTAGQKIAKGQPIGKVGSTGQSTGSHLHFEIHYQGVQIDPMKVITQ